MSDQSTTHLQASIDRLSAELAALNAARPPAPGFWQQFLGQVLRGLAFAFGALLAIGILGGLVAWWISQIDIFPAIGDWISRILLAVEIPERLMSLRSGS